ncbi:MAG: DnaB-like helicase C-terminal domain-containing protein [Armatimonadota bacterium]
MTVSVYERIPPQNMEAEQAVLGAMLLDVEAIERAVEMLAPEDFYREAHRTLFLGIKALFMRQEPADQVTLGNWLRQHDQLEAVGGTLYLQQMMSTVPTAAGIRNYAKIVRAKSLQRQLIKAADEVTASAYEACEDAPALVRQAESRFLAITDAVQQDSGAVMRSVGEWERQAIQSRREADARGYADGFKTPLPKVNGWLQPFLPEQLILLAAQPGLGKSALLYQFCYTACADQGQRGLLVTLEMSADQIAMRRLIQDANITRWQATNMHWRTSHPEIYNMLDVAAEHSSTVPLLTLNAPTLAPVDVLLWARRARRQLGGLDFIGIDYLQRMRDNRNTADLRERTTEIARELKGLAKRLKVPVLAISSLNRAQYAGGKTSRPGLYSLRESGDLEYEADIVLMLHRPDPSDPQRTEFGIVKQREGAGDQWLDIAYDAKHTWFYDAPESIPEG